MAGDAAAVLWFEVAKLEVSVAGVLGAGAIEADAVLVGWDVTDA